MQKALIVWGGWRGHEPEAVAHLFAGMLKELSFDVIVSDTLASFEDEELMQEVNLIIPNWTNGEISKQQLDGLMRTVHNGCGLAGCHAGMCGAFRNQVDYHYMTGGQWVQHPGDDGVQYQVCVIDREHPVTKGIGDFDVTTEQYYMHIDPAVHVHAVTNFGRTKMPVIWTKMWGSGKVYYNSLGHSPEILTQSPVYELMKKGFAWAARSH